MSASTPQTPLPPNDSRGPVFAGSVSLFFILATFFFFSRIYIRLWTLKTFWWDDALLVFAYVTATTEYAVVMVQVVHGYGRHIQYLSLNDININAKMGYVAQLVWVWAITFVKMSMCLLLLRIRPGWFWSLVLFTAFQFAIGVSTTITHFIRCRPIAANWDPTVPGAQCWAPKDISNSYYILSALYVATDLVFALLPLTFIFKIHRPLREKIVLVFLMGFGLIASACAAAKMSMISRFSTMTDFTYDPVIMGIWAHLEQFIGIIAACIPCLKGPFEHALKYFGLWSVSEYSNPSNGRYVGPTREDPNMRLNVYKSTSDESDGDRSLPRKSTRSSV